MRSAILQSAKNWSWPPKSMVLCVRIPMDAACPEKQSSQKSMQVCDGLAWTTSTYIKFIDGTTKRRSKKRLRSSTPLSKPGKLATSEHLPCTPGSFVKHCTSRLFTDGLAL